jgi:hypothetical protein
MAVRTQCTPFEIHDAVYLRGIKNGPEIPRVSEEDKHTRTEIKRKRRNGSGNQIGPDLLPRRGAPTPAKLVYTQIEQERDYGHDKASNIEGLG